MVLNLFVFIYIQILSTFIYLAKIRLSYGLSLFVLFVLFVLVGFRLVGYDLSSYRYIYNGYASGDIIRVMEPTVEVISLVSDYFGLGYRGFLLAYSAVTFSLILFVSKLYKVNLVIFLSLYVVFFLASGPAVSIRASVSSIFILMAIFYFFNKSRGRSIIFFLLAISFHYSSLVLLVVLFSYFTASYFKNLIMYSFLMTGLVVIALFSIVNIDFGFLGGFFQYLQDRLYIYLLEVEVDYSNLSHVALIFRQLVISLFTAFILYKINSCRAIANSPLLSFLFVLVAFSTFFSLFSLFFGFSVFGTRVFDILTVGVIILIIKSEVRLFFPVIFISAVNCGYFILGYFSVLLDAYRP